MKNIALQLMYVGTAYHGWQIQKNAVSVEETLEKLAGVTKHSVDDIGSYKAMPEYNDDWESYRAENPAWNAIPFDQEFAAGSSVLSVLTAFRDLYPGYEMFFDMETNAFICQQIGRAHV